MNLKANTFERLAFSFLGFGRGAQVGENFTFGSGIYFTAQASTLGVFNFPFGTLQALGSRQNRRFLEEDGAFFFYNAKRR